MPPNTNHRNTLQSDQVLRSKLVKSTLRQEELEVEKAQEAPTSNLAGKSRLSSGPLPPNLVLPTFAPSNSNPPNAVPLEAVPPQEHPIDPMMLP